MEGKHTPGPWKLDNEPSFHRNRVWTEDMRPIVNLCSMGMSPADIDPEAQANARLIAAAPDLLEALHRVWDDIDDETMPATVEIIRAAIAKAEGRISGAGSAE